VQLAINICLVMVAMMFLERVYMCCVLFYVKVFRRSPSKMYKFQPMRDEVEIGTSHYPMVLVQVPMYNEREVYQLSIGAACNLAWPADRIIIQILDDSTDPEIKVYMISVNARFASLDREIGDVQVSCTHRVLCALADYFVADRLSCTLNAKDGLEKESTSSMRSGPTGLVTRLVRSEKE
jgi:cellulose synthase/poly-beta-1,6-N-acetylglucosamine synthase-like glycosyltransferase